MVQKDSFVSKYINDDPHSLWQCPNKQTFFCLLLLVEPIVLFGSDIILEITIKDHFLSLQLNRIWRTLDVLTFLWKISSTFILLSFLFFHSFNLSENNWNRKKFVEDEFFSLYFLSSQKIIFSNLIWCVVLYWFLEIQSSLDGILIIIVEQL